MNKIIVLIACLMPFVYSCKNENDINSEKESKSVAAITYSPAQALVAKMVDKVGSMDDLKVLKDVEYTYTYLDTEKKLKDVSLERYMFDGEKSWAKYSIRQKSAYPYIGGDVVQGYDGKTAWLNIDGQYSDDPKLLRRADFSRKTNFYWFAMMPKLMDPGIQYSELKDRVVNGKTYKIVKVTYDADVGDVQDEYLLYINPETNLVDQFLFTVKDFNKTEPLLMKVGYDKVSGMWLPTKRSYTQSNWQGDVIGKNWTDEISENIKFNNGFTDALFALPSNK